LLSETPKVNQLVTIKLGKDQSPDYAYYHSRVEFISHKRLVLAAPIKERQVVPVKPGEIITVNYWVGTKSYCFTSEVLQFTRDNLSTITVAWPCQVKRLYRRQFFRVGADLSLILAPTENKRIYHTKTLDVSGGGVLVKSPVRLQRNEYVEMQITLPKGGVFDTLGRVVRVEEVKSGKETGYLTGIEFAVIDERDRERIIAYVFERQRHLMKKRLT